MAQITRSQFRNALYDIGVAQQAAAPTLLRQVLRWRPGGMTGEKPVMWVGQIVEVLTYDTQTRARTMSAEVVIADLFPSDLVGTTDSIDELVDALVERTTATFHVIPNTVLEIVGAEDGEVAFGGPERTDLYRGVTLAVRLQIWEGRG